jgi:hypothetical protein
MSLNSKKKLVKKNAIKLKSTLQMWPQKQNFKISKFGDFFSEETGTFRFILLFFAFWRKKMLVHIYMVIFVNGSD